MIEAKDPLSEQVIGLAIEVHRTLGPGLLESIYELALCHELQLAGIHYHWQREIDLCYKGQSLGSGLRADIIVSGCLVLELITVDRISEFHVAQLLTYLRLMEIKRGLVLNVNAMPLKNGIRRISI